MAILNFKQLTKTNPFQHFVLMFAVYLIISLLVFAFSLDAEIKWICIFTILIFYCWVNPIIGAFYDKYIQYTLQSTAFILLLIAVILLSEKFINNDYFLDSFTNTMLLTATLIFYFVALGMCGLFRFFVQVLDKSPS